MDEQFFKENYLPPPSTELFQNFIQPLPSISGLNNSSELIVQSKAGDTYSTNVITKYNSDALNLSLVEVYKNTENLVSGNFVRLVGTISVLRKGLPYLFIDSAIVNINPFTAKREKDLSMFMAVHTPQMDDQTRQNLLNQLQQAIQPKGFEAKVVTKPTMPDFWGPLWVLQVKGLNLHLIELIRNRALSFYSELTQNVADNKVPEYHLVQKQMIYQTAQGEHQAFKKMGLTVPVEAQAAFFTTLVGIGG